MGSVLTMGELETADPLLTAEDVALKLRVSKDWVWDHSSRRSTKAPPRKFHRAFSLSYIFIALPQRHGNRRQLPPRLIARESSELHQR